MRGNMKKTVTLELTDREINRLRFILEWVNDEEVRDILDNTDEGSDLSDDEYEDKVTEWCEDIESIHNQL